MTKRMTIDKTKILRILQNLWAIRTVFIVFLAVILPLSLVTDGDVKFRCAYALVVMAILWLTEALPIPVTALMPIFLFPLLGVQPAKVVCSNYVNETTMLFLGGLVVAVAVEEVNLHRRIALGILKILGKQPNLLMLGLMLPTWFLSMWISNTAATSMMVPIITAVTSSVENIHSKNQDNHPDGEDNPGFEMSETGSDTGSIKRAYSCSIIGDDDTIVDSVNSVTELKKNTKPKKSITLIRMSKGFSLSVAYAANIGGIATLTGTPPNLILQGTTNNSAFPRDSTPSVFIAVLLFFLPAKLPNIFCLNESLDGGTRVKPVYTPILDWNNTVNKLPWGVIILLGGGFALADASGSSGLSTWVGQKLTVFGALDPWFTNFILCLIVSLATEVTSNSATATLLMPVMAELAISIGEHPLYLMISTAAASSFAFMLPVATPPNAIVFTTGYVKIVDMAAVGLIMNVIAVIILPIAINTWGKPIFGLDTIPPFFSSNFTTTTIRNT